MSDVMTPTQFASIRRKFGVDPVTFAIELGYSGNRNTMKTMMRRFENGTRPIPLNVARYVWLMDQWRLLNMRLGGASKDFPKWPEWPGYEAAVTSQQSGGADV